MGFSSWSGTSQHHFGITNVTVMWDTGGQEEQRRCEEAALLRNARRWVLTSHVLSTCPKGEQIATVLISPPGYLFALGGEYTQCILNQLGSRGQLQPSPSILSVKPHVVAAVQAELGSHAGHAAKG